MGKPVIRAGLIFGLIIAALRLLDQGATLAVELSAGGPTSNVQFTDPTVAYLLLLSLASFVLFFVYLSLYLWAGTVAARKTGSVGSGTLAGLFAALVASIIGTAVNIGLYVSGLLPVATTGATTTTYGPIDSTVLLTLAIGTAIFGMVLDIAFGAGLGALGGLIGRSIYARKYLYQLAGFAGGYLPPGAYPPPGAYVWYGPYPAPGYYPGVYPPAYPPPPGPPAGSGATPSQQGTVPDPSQPSPSESESPSPPQSAE